MAQGFHAGPVENALGTSQWGMDHYPGPADQVPDRTRQDIDPPTFNRISNADAAVRSLWMAFEILPFEQRVPVTWFFHAFRSDKCHTRVGHGRIWVISPTSPAGWPGVTVSRRQRARLPLARRISPFSMEGDRL
jgi:hypothetical protein